MVAGRHRRPRARDDRRGAVSRERHRWKPTIRSQKLVGEHEETAAAAGARASSSSSRSSISSARLSSLRRERLGEVSRDRASQSDRDPRPHRSACAAASREAGSATARAMRTRASGFAIGRTQSGPRGSQPKRIAVLPEPARPLRCQTAAARAPARSARDLRPSRSRSPPSFRTARRDFRARSGTALREPARATARSLGSGGQSPSEKIRLALSRGISFRKRETSGGSPVSISALP